MGCETKKPEFVLRKTVNRTAVLPCGFKEHFTWDIWRRIKGGEEFVAEFEDHFGPLARKALRALNKCDTGKG